MRNNGLSWKESNDIWATGIAGSKVVEEISDLERRDIRSRYLGNAKQRQLKPSRSVGTELCSWG